MKDRTVAWMATLLVAVHLLINVGHAVAHQRLGIELASWQIVFILIVIGVGPILSAVLVWSGYSRLGTLLLGGSMAAALLFGISYHYVFPSPDHVAHLPPGELQGLFRSTALLLALSQAAGVALAIWGFRRLQSTLVTGEPTGG